MKKTKGKLVSVKEQQRRQQLRMGNQDPAMIARRRMGLQVFWMRKKGWLLDIPMQLRKKNSTAKRQEPIQKPR